MPFGIIRSRWAGAPLAAGLATLEFLEVVDAHTRPKSSAMSGSSGTSPIGPLRKRRAGIRAPPRFGNLRAYCCCASSDASLTPNGAWREGTTPGHLHPCRKEFLDTKKEFAIPRVSGQPRQRSGPSRPTGLVTHARTPRLGGPHIPDNLRGRRR